MCEDPPPQNSKEDSAHPQTCKTFQVHSPPFMLSKGSYKQLCRARWAVTFCARTHRLKRARRILRSHAHPQACKTFQVLCSPVIFQQRSCKQLCRAQRAVTLCARTHRLTRATRVAVSRAYSKALKTFRVLSPPSRRSLYSPDNICRARRAVTRFARTHHLKRTRGIVHTRKPARPFRSLALPSCFNRDRSNSFAERGGLSRFVQGPTASKEQGGSCAPMPTRKLARPFRSYALPSCSYRDIVNSFAERGGLSRFVQGPTASQEQGVSPSPKPTRKP